MKSLIPAFFFLFLFLSSSNAQTESISHDVNGLRVFHQTSDSISILAQHMNWGKTSNNISSGLYSTTWGADNEATSNQATAWGINNTASLWNTTAFGNSTAASGSHATSWGAFTVASGAYSTASGSETTVSGEYAMGWGRKNILSSAYGAVWGQENSVGFTYGTAWGFQNIVQGHLGTSWGYDNLVTGDTSTVWGSNNQASAMHNSIWGRRNESSGGFSTVWGRNNSNAGVLGTVWGEDLIANAYLNTILGRYNVNRQGTADGWKESETLFAVGNGNEDEGRDGLIMLKNGNIGLNFMLEDGLPSEILDVNGNIRSAQNVQANQLLADQNIGIGTTNPTAHLEILNESGNSNALIKSITGVSTLDLEGAPTANVRMLEDGVSQAEMRWTGTNFDFYSSPPVTFPLLRTPALRMTKENYVGIRKGLLQPTEALDVNGRVKIGDGTDTPSAGVLRYNQADAVFEGFNGTSWNRMDGLPMDEDGDSKIKFAEASTDSIKFIVNGDEQMSFNGHSLDIGKNGNTFIGHETSRQDYNSNTGNTSLGWLSTPFIFSGVRNTNIGFWTGYNLTTGDFNTNLGAYSGFSNQDGFRNTALGYYAGYENTGSGNVFLGHMAGRYETGNDQLYIDNSDTNSPLIKGDFSTDEVSINGKFFLPDEASPTSSPLNLIITSTGEVIAESVSLRYYSSDFSDWLGLISNVRHAKCISRDVKDGQVIRRLVLRAMRFNPTVPNLEVDLRARNLTTGQYQTLATISVGGLPTSPTNYVEILSTPVVVDTAQFEYFLTSDYSATQIIYIQLL